VKLLALVAALLVVSGCSSAIAEGISAGGAVAAPAPIGAQAPHQIPEYDRDAFGDGWDDADDDCQNTRQEILLRDLVDVALTTDGCDVTAGTLHDVYTGEVIPFQRGQTTSDAVQIDHVIPLSYAWQAGAWQWGEAERKAFSNDPANLRAVDGPTNNSKGDRGPSRWLPPSTNAHCAYAASWRTVTGSYALVLDPADTAAVDDILNAC
jgi:5-methylcytosine-specific restriction endonuclease McrA